MGQSETRRRASDPEILELYRQVHALRQRVAELEDERAAVETTLMNEREQHRRMLDAAQIRTERAHAERQRLLGTVAHDLRTPLGAAQMRVTLLLDTRRGEPLDPEQRRHAEAIRRCLDRASRLITDLLDASAIEAGRLRVDRRPTSARSLLDAAVEMAKPLVAEAGVALETRGPVEDAEIACDRDRILQVLGNLIGNATKHTPEGGTITVSMSIEVERVEVTVEDTGRGIDPKDLPHVLDPYWRGRGGGKGLGLGLSIAKGLIEAHGGTIRIDSSPGKGTRVTFTLSR